MTIASQTSRVSYSGDGTTTTFAVQFKFLLNGDLVVYLRDASGNQTLQVLGANYSVTGAGVDAGGAVTFALPPASGKSVVIYRDPPVTQTTSYNNNDPFPAKSHENALDKLTMLMQRLVNRMGRVPALAESSSFSALTLPDPDPGKYLKWNANNTGLENSSAVTFAPNSYPVATQSEAEAAALNTVLMTPLRAVQQAIVRDTRVDVRDYGAIGDGNSANKTINRIAINAAITAVAATGGTVFFPNHVTYFVDGELNIAGRGSVKLMAPGYAGALGPDSGNAALILTAASGALLNLNGSQGIEICGLNLGYNNAGYLGDLIDLQTDGVSLSTNIHIHHCRIGGIQGAAAGANSLINATGCLKLTVEHGFMDAALVGILGTSLGGATNTVAVNDIWFDRGFGCPIVAGGSSWTIEKCIFELNLSNAAVAIQITNAGVESLNIIGCHFDDGSTTGTWINLNGGSIQGGLIIGNWLRNGACAMSFGASDDLLIAGNTIYALESAAPVNPGTSTNCFVRANKIRTDSGLNVPGLLTGAPGDGWDWDNKDGVGRQYLGRTVFTAGTTARSPARFTPGTAPTSPVDGDMWYDGTNVKFRAGGTTKTFTLA